MVEEKQSRIRLALATGALGIVALPAGNTQAVEFDMQMQATFQPTFFSNFDFDSDRRDDRTATSAGLVDVGDEFVRGEFRWGATAAGDRWTGKILLESDTFLDSGQADGDAVNVERTYFTYEFDPALVLQLGHEFKVPDFAAGGLLYGDDHPILGFKGDTGFGSYDTYWIIINDTDAPGQGSQDSNVYLAQLEYDLGAAGTASPIVAFHRNSQVDADVFYFGGTYLGSVGMVDVKGEVFGALGGYDNDTDSAVNFRDGVVVPDGAASLEGDDISAFAANLTLELPLDDRFKPNIGFRYTSGDDDPFDDDVEGWLGISDISGFVAPMNTGFGMLRFGPNQNAAFSAPVFGSTFETSGPATGGASTDGSAFGGIGNSGTALNPGQIVVAPGVSGSLTPKFSYMANVWFIWYANTDGLEVLPGAEDDVDNFAGTNLNIRLDYAATENVTFSAGGSVVVPGDGVEDATGTDDPGGVGILQAQWSF